MIGFYAGSKRAARPTLTKRFLWTFVRPVWLASVCFPSVVLAFVSTTCVVFAAEAKEWPIAALSALVLASAIYRAVSVELAADGPVARWYRLRLAVGWYRLCRANSLAGRGWVRSDKKSGFDYFPVLQSVRYRDGVLDVTMHLLPLDHEDKDWDISSMEETIRAALLFRHGRSWMSAEEVDVVHFRLMNRPMPKSVPFGAEHLPKGRKVALGPGADGENYSLDLTASPHTIVSGETNFGKSSFVRGCFIVKALTQEWNVVILDGKGIDYGPFGWIGAEVHSAASSDKGFEDPSELHEIISGFLHRMNRTRHVMEALGVGESFSSLQSKVRRIGGANDPEAEAQKYGFTWEELDKLARPTLFVLDEFGSAMRASGRKSGSQDRAHANFATWTQKCRAFGHHIVVVAQRPDVQDFGQYGGQARAQFGNRVSFGRLDRSGLEMVYGDRAKDSDISAAANSRVKGRGAVLGSAEAGTDVVQIQAPWLSEAEAVRLVLEARPEFATEEAVRWFRERYEAEEAAL